MWDQMVLVLSEEPVVDCGCNEEDQVGRATVSKSCLEGLEEDSRTQHMQTTTTVPPVVIRGMSLYYWGFAVYLTPGMPRPYAARN